MIWWSVSHPGKLSISGLRKRIKTRKCLMEYITVDLKNLNRNKRMFIWWNGAEAGLRQSRVEYWVYNTFLIFIKSSHWIVIKWKTVSVSRASSYHVWPRLFLARKSSSTTFKKFLPFEKNTLSIHTYELYVELWTFHRCYHSREFSHAHWIHTTCSFNGRIPLQLGNAFSFIQEKRHRLIIGAWYM